MSNNKAQRTDPHRKGAIVPANYTYVFSYYLGNSTTRTPAFNTDKLLALRESGVKFFKGPFGDGAGKCSACGAWFMEGDVWRHEPTGEHIHLGHDCADKYEMLCDRSEFELELGRIKEAAAIVIVRKQNDEARTKFLEEHPGLAEDFKDGAAHPIVENIHNSFVNWLQISEKQIALVHKLAEEIRHPEVVAEAVNAAVPAGRIAIEGEILGVKAVDGFYGTTLKMLVVIHNADGSEYKIFGSVPSSLHNNKPLKGQKISMTATLEPKEPGFGFFSRPSKAQEIVA